jgi:hypothetical protein
MDKTCAEEQVAVIPGADELFASRVMRKHDVQESQNLNLLLGRSILTAIPCWRTRGGDRGNAGSTRF